MREAPIHQQAINRTWELCSQFSHDGLSLSDSLASLLQSPVEMSFKRIALISKLLLAYQSHTNNGPTVPTKMPEIFGNNDKKIPGITELPIGI